ncbi:hypothetical protein LCGC14_3083410, partial [marine sediment metagenome]
MTKSYFLLLLAGLAACGCAPLPEPPGAPATEPAAILSRTHASAGVTLVRLANGLTVIIGENHNAPVVCVRSYIRAGGMYEGKYLGTGVSHLCEHLVAKGAVHDGGGGARKPKQTSSRLDRIGGQSNAFTSLAHTGYYIAAASGMTGECIDLMADWMVRPEIAQADFDREHGVVQRELEMGRDNPGRQMWYANASNFFGTHPASVPVIGRARPLAGLTRADVLDYHGRMYVPQNMVLAVVGDIDPQAAIEQILQQMQGFYKGRSVEFTLPKVPPVSGVRRVVRR